MKTANQVLDDMLVILAVPDHWTKGNMAKTLSGSSTDVFGDDAYCFCMLGARRKVIGARGPDWAMGPRGSARIARDRMVAAARTLFPDRMESGDQICGVSFFNDHPDTTHADVLAVLRLARAI